MKLTFSPMDEAAARQIAAWHYAPPYDLYNTPSRASAELIQALIDPANQYYQVRDEQGDLIAFRCYGPEGRVRGGDYSTEALDTGGGLRPDLTGRGLGLEVIQAGLAFGREAFSPPAFRVTVAAFNQRAQKVIQKAGFQFEQEFSRPSDGKQFRIFVKPET